jgi:SOS-response transcriptional repressor LexA
MARKSFSLSAPILKSALLGEGIKEGDLVIVERGRQPKHGDVVLAEVDGEWTIRYFTRERGRVILRADDPQHSPVIPQTEMPLAGVVTAVIRKYHR